MSNATKLIELRAQAEATKAQFPQYKGHWDNYVLGQAKRQISVRGRLVANAGELVLVHPSDELHAGYKTIFSPHNLGGCDTLVKEKDIALIG